MNLVSILLFEEIFDNLLFLKHLLGMFHLNYFRALVHAALIPGVLIFVLQLVKRKEFLSVNISSRIKKDFVLINVFIFNLSFKLLSVRRLTLLVLFIPKKKKVSLSHETKNTFGRSKLKHFTSRYILVSSCLHIFTIARKIEFISAIKITFTIITEYSRNSNP